MNILFLIPEDKQAELLQALRNYWPHAVPSRDIRNTNLIAYWDLITPTKAHGPYEELSLTLKNAKLGLTSQGEPLFTYDQLYFHYSYGHISHGTRQWKGKTTLPMTFKKLCNAEDLNTIVKTLFTQSEALKAKNLAPA